VNEHSSPPPGIASAAPVGLELDEAAAPITAVVQGARYRGVELDREALGLARLRLASPPATPVEWLKEAGLWTQGSKTTSWHMGLWW
jgi:hypothetical protein